MLSSSAPRAAARTRARTPARAVVRAAGALLVLGSGAAGLAGCTGHGAAVTEVGTGEILDASDTAYVGDHPIVFMVPSGRVTVTVDDVVSSVPPIDTADGTSLLADPGTGLVGLTWTLDRGAYPDATTDDVAPPATVLGRPRTVGLALEAGGVRYEVPGVGTMAGFGVHPSSTVWVGVPAAAAPGSLRVQVDYAGVTQTGVVASGRVDPGRAAPLYAPTPRDRATSCTVSGPVASGCRLDDGVGYPYLDALGWAPAGRHFALVAVLTTGAVSDVTLDGRVAMTTLGDVGLTSTLHAFLLDDGPGSHRLRGRVVRDGRPRTLTATLPGYTAGTASSSIPNPSTGPPTGRPTTGRPTTGPAPGPTTGETP